MAVQARTERADEEPNVALLVAALVFWGAMGWAFLHFVVWAPTMTHESMALGAADVRHAMAARARIDNSLPADLPVDVKLPAPGVDGYVDLGMVATWSMGGHSMTETFRWADASKVIEGDLRATGIIRKETTSADLLYLPSRSGASSQHDASVHDSGFAARMEWEWPRHDDPPPVAPDRVP